MLETTIDGILNNRLKVEQPAKGFRIAVDTILLASAVPVLEQQRVLEIGCGVGGVMLALAWRVPSLSVLGIDVQGELVDLCRANIARNGFQNRVQACRGDGTDLSLIEAGAFDHVVFNPPYHDARIHDVSPNPIKGTANTVEADALAKWVATASYALKDQGQVTLIHRGDCLAFILKLLQGAWGNCRITPVVTKEGQPAKRVIVSATKGGKQPPVTREALVLHLQTGGYTPQAEALLREGKALS